VSLRAGKAPVPIAMDKLRFNDGSQ
jgi:hypothetical protein